MSNDLSTFYSEMFLIRTVENTFLRYHSKGLIKGTVHTCLGQEACAVGVVSALDRQRDVLFSSHRAHGHFIAYCDKVEALVAEVLGRPDGICGGVGGTQHLHWNNLYTNGIQGGIVPPATGAALAEKLKGSGAIVAVFLGDGTMGQGTVYESFNISSVFGLPLLYVLENNQYAQSTSVRLTQADGMEERATAFGIRNWRQYGNRVMDVHATAREAAAWVRSENKPAFLALNTYRLGPHSKGDDNRAEEEIQQHWKSDPMALAAGGLAAGEQELLETEVRKRVERIFDQVYAGEGA